MNQADRGEGQIAQDYRWLIGPALSLLLYAIGFTLGLFLIPLQVVLERYKDGTRLLSMGIVLAGVLVLRLAVPRPELGALGQFPLWEALAVLSMLGVRNFLYGVSGELKVFLEYLTVSLVSVPILLMVANDENFRVLLAELLFGIFAIEANPDSEVVNLMIASFQRMLGLGLFLAGFVTIFIGKMIGSMPFRTSWQYRIAEFRVNTSPWLWILIVAWAAVLADLRFSFGPLGVLFWNLGLGTAFLYALQGFAIIQSWMLKKSGTRVSPLGLIFLLMFLPGVNAVVAIALPLLGISETWVPYKSRLKEIDVNESDS